MRRAGGLWPHVASFAALTAAARRAARGQRRSRGAATLLDALEPECLRLERELQADGWRPGPTHRFVIHDPKPREITVAPFADRVVHHALIAPLEPVFERRMIADSYACRRGKGTHAAVRRAQALLRRHRYSLRLDVASFFASLAHDVVLESLARLVKDRRVLQLTARIVAGPTLGDPAVGLPIGSLTSQWLANIVLDRVDHLIVESAERVPGYVRYMDLCVAAHKWTTWCCLPTIARGSGRPTTRSRRLCGCTSR
ncbi:MAG: reverse transcriptase/maturase family protein [Planctomycetota bacterium]